MKIIERIKRFRDTPAVVFGASSEGRTVCKILEEYRVPLSCIIDNNKLKTGERSDGVFIRAPEYLEQSDNYIVIVPSVYYKAMYAQLMDMNIPKAKIYNFEIYEKTLMLFDVPYKLRLYMLLNKYFRKK